MTDILLLRFDAPLMSFGGVAVDEHGVTAPFPGLSLLTGLLANALGWDHRESSALERLQERIRCGARCDRPGEALEDYQTVDLGQAFLRHAWTTRGAPSSRGGGSASTGTHIRHRHYWADSIFTIAVSLDPIAESPDVAELARALANPQRPLFLGRKPCLPAAPLLLGRLNANSLREALVLAPMPEALRIRNPEQPCAAWWPADEDHPPTLEGGRLIPVFDRRDWANQVHTGRRMVWAGTVSPAPGEQS